MDIGARIKELRLKSGLSQYRLAQLAGVAQSFIRDMEAGKTKGSIGVPVVERISLALGLTLADFFKNEIEDMSPEVARLINQAKTLAPDQIHQLNQFLATLQKPKDRPATSRVKEKASHYRPGLEKFLPKNEKDLGEALLRITEIAFEEGLKKDEIMHLNRLAVEHYGKPQRTKNDGDAAHGPKSPGQLSIRRRRKPEDD